MEYRITKIGNVKQTKGYIDFYIEAVAINGSESISFNANIPGATMEELEIVVGTILDISYVNGQRIVAWDV